MEPVMFTPEVIAGIVGLVLTLIFAYFPGLRQKYAVLAKEVKQFIMLGLLLLAETIICVLSYYGVIITEPAFTLNTALKVAFALLVANQPVYKLLPQANDVKELVIVRDAKEIKAVLKDPPKQP